jgi:ABC-2 type transport system ATP-binding protein
MVQRVGIAQAILNDPELIFLDEPMSGLDPLGRRDIRELILKLRDQGKTVFFSSHILADAEALCSRVAILAGGRLAASGRLADVLAHEIRGWEVVVSDVSRGQLESFGSRVTRIVEVAAGTQLLELPKDVDPAALVRDLVAIGATLVSVNPVHTTLEDFFVQKVQSTESVRQEALR